MVRKEDSNRLPNTLILPDPFVRNVVLYPQSYPDLWVATLEPVLVVDVFAAKGRPGTTKVGVALHGLLIHAEMHEDRSHGAVLAQ
jgi:hypothetical protein